MDKHIPERMCVVCRERKEKSAFIRVVKTPDGFVVTDDKTVSGRGAYVCKNEKCIKTAVKKRAFDRSFKQRLPDEVYTALQAVTTEQFDGGK